MNVTNVRWKITHKSGQITCRQPTYKITKQLNESIRIHRLMTMTHKFPNPQNITYSTMVSTTKTSQNLLDKSRGLVFGQIVTLNHPVMKIPPNYVKGTTDYIRKLNRVYVSHMSFGYIGLIINLLRHITYEVTTLKIKSSWPHHRSASKTFKSYNDVFSKLIVALQWAQLRHQKQQ